MKRRELIRRAIADLGAVAEQQARIRDPMPLWQRVKLESVCPTKAQRPPTPPEFEEASIRREKANKIDAELRDLAKAQDPVA